MIPHRSSERNYVGSTRGDVLGGALAAVVTLPVALSMGTLSGLGPAAGIYGAVAFGAIAALFGGTRGLVYGPNSSVAFAIAVIIADSQNRLATAVIVAVLAGAIQVLLGSLRVGHYLAYTPHSVISGLLSGIGVLIVVSQTLIFLGAPAMTGGLQTIVGAWPDALADINTDALAVAAVTFAVATGWPNRFNRWVPPTAAAVAAGTLLGVLWLSNAPAIGEVSVGMPDLLWPDLSGAELVRLMPGAFTIAVLGSVDALVAARIAHGLTGSHGNPDREIIAQGLGNISAGAVGGLAGASSVGMFVNIEAGGRTPLAGVVCAATLLTLAVALNDLVDVIPEAVLAGILLKIGLDLIDWRVLVGFAKNQHEHAVVLVVTLTVTVFYSLVAALVVGLLAGALVLARRFEQLEVDSVISVPLLDQTFFGLDPNNLDPNNLDPNNLDPNNLDPNNLDPNNLDPNNLDPNNLDPNNEDSFSARVGLVVLRGSFTAASATAMIKTLGADIKGHEVVIVDLCQTSYIDDSAGMVTHQIINLAHGNNTGCIIMGLHGQPQRCLSALGVLRLLPEHCVVATMDEARDIALQLLNG